MTSGVGNRYSKTLIVINKPNFINVIIPILAGLIAYVAIGLLCIYLLKIGWEDYALRSKDKSYTFSMLLARQFVAILSAIAAGLVSGKLSNGSTKLVLGVAVIIFCTGSYIHFFTQTWVQYPLWYHLTFVLLIIPITVGSSKLVRYK